MAAITKNIEKTMDCGLGTEDIDGILGFSYVADAIEHELRVFWHFTWRDWSAAIIPGTMCTIAALRALDSTLSAGFTARSVLYCLLFLYAFDIANQINGIAEDQINKPDRPLPSGRVSLRGAYIRWYASTAAYLAAGAAWGVLPWTALWVCITICLTFGDGDKHWATKNMLFMTAGSLCLLQGAWGLVAPPSARETRWTVLLSSAFGILASLQDLRDVEGDRVAGRRTLPIVLGDNFRWVMAALTCAVPAICWKLEFLHYSHVLVGYCGAALTLSTFYMAYRILRGSSRKYDHKTYMILTYIFCGCVAVPVVFP
ncbi:UbiA prenyltransferase family-domain-containing protein [Mycena pura]|uniref:UbiA prenyltransferase family-domain-containing protein n=1 Tax=Mycena pura TaxID=153505 RepID=A0AAD6V3J4_9AGAR|nr:UbiA prenyltransferase family-domain-containing protein [Mycena pura]